MDLTLLGTADSDQQKDKECVFCLVFPAHWPNQLVRQEALVWSGLNRVVVTRLCLQLSGAEKADLEASIRQAVEAPLSALPCCHEGFLAG